MLYECWRKTVQEHGSELALRDLASGQQWTFASLARDVEALPKPDGPLVYPQGHGADCVLEVLRGWRWGAIVCPLEPGQAAPEVPVPPSPLAHLKTTSATTGLPRGVAFTGPQLAADAENIVTTMGLRPDWPNLAVISMAHSYGFSNLVLPLALCGIPLVIGSSPLPEALRQAAESASDLTLPAVPALWRAWLDADAIPRNVRLALSAGAPLPATLEQAVFSATGLKIHNFYGSSECGGIAYDATEQPRTDDTCVGAPMRNVALEVNNDGCLEVCSRAVAETYWPEPQPALGGGRFRTADLVELKDGKVFLRGRLSDLINVAGRKVAPEIIERALLEHPAVRDCLVFGVPSAEVDRSELIAAVVAARGQGSADTLRQFLLGRLPPWQVPREWRFVESLQTNARGKVSRAEWRNRFIETRPAR
jgi:long-chain acyl-CoA synthetase